MVSTIHSLSAQVLLPPQPYCANVLSDGSVQLSWINPAGANSSYSYKIFRNEDGGNGFQNIFTETNYTVSSFIDNATNANLGARKYYLQTIANGSSAPSSFFSTLFLTLNSGDGGSVAQLSWNNPQTNQTPNGTYTLYRTSFGQTESLLTTLPASQNTYLDTLYGLCSDTLVPVSYRVELQTDLCTMSSQTATRGFKDGLPPVPPTVETVLIDPATGHAVIYWYAGSEPDLKNYIIQNQNFLNIGVVPADQPPVFVNDFITVDNGPVSLNVIPSDSCGQLSSFTDFFTTMYATSAYEDCAQQALVKWTEYEGWSEGVAAYTVYASINMQPYVILSTLSGNETEYEFDIQINSVYNIYIEATSNGDQRPSTTNATEFKTQYPRPVSFNYQSSVSTLEDNSIEITLLQDSEAEKSSYELYKAKSSGNFQFLESFDANPNPSISYIDTDVDADNLVYTYKWKSYDGCGVETMESNTAHNIVLDAFSESTGLENTLQWNAYGFWDGGVAEYQVWRSLGDDGDFQMLTSLDADNLNFQEDVSSFSDSEGRFCYQVRAVEFENQYGLSAKSISNEVCITQAPRMFIPNAIVRDGENRVFMPKASFIDFDSYQMEISDKWFQKVFYSDDIAEGWDGTYRGQQVREDYYRYIISYRDAAGQPFLEEGVVYVLGRK